MKNGCVINNLHVLQKSHHKIENYKNIKEDIGLFN